MDKKPRKPRSDKGKPRKTGGANAHIQLRLNGDPEVRLLEAQAAGLWHKLVDEFGNPKKAFIEMIIGYEEARKGNFQPTTQVTVDKQMRQMLKRAVDLMDSIVMGGTVLAAADNHPPVNDHPHTQSVADFTYDAKALMGNVVFFDDED